MNFTLLTGGLGYIGSHIAVDLINNEHNVVIVDNLSNSSIETLDKIKSISSKFNKNIIFFNVDITNYEDVNNIFESYKINSVIHLAALKSIPESFNYPDLYYKNNVVGLKNIFSLSDKHNVRSFIFSSSAAIYDFSNKYPVNESGTLGYSNPYAKTKLQCEEFLQENHKNNNFSVGILRYFNPAGNIKSGLIGDFIKKESSNLFPMIFKSILNNDEILIFGSDYNTFDGSPIRDFIHVVDLSNAHVSTMTFLENTNGIHVFNVGTGSGFTVKQILDTFADVNSVKINYKFSERRLGDIGISFADTSKIYSQIGWRATKSIEDICKDAFKFFKENYL